MAGRHGKASEESMNNNIKELTQETHEIITNAYQQEHDGNITAEQRAEVVANTLRDFERQTFDGGHPAER